MNRANYDNFCGRDKDKDQQLRERPGNPKSKSYNNGRKSCCLHPWHIQINSLTSHLVPAQQNQKHAIIIIAHLLVVTTPTDFNITEVNFVNNKNFQ